MTKGASPSRFGHIPALDGMRGLAALIVFAAHASFRGMDIVPGLDCSGIGKYGVFLFFILSAYVLTTPFVEKGRNAFTVNFLAHYATRRFLRVYPLYWVYVTCAVLTTVVLPQWIPGFPITQLPLAMGAADYLDHLLLRKGFRILWSIVVEFRYYLLIPVVGWVFSVLLARRLLSCLVVGIGAVVGISWQFPPVPNDEFSTDLIPYLPLFLAGSCLAVLQYGANAGGWFRPLERQWIVEGLGILAAGSIVLKIPAVWCFLNGVPIDPYRFQNHYEIWALQWSLVLMAALNGAGIIRRFFEASFLRTMGRISFSVYLIHMVVLNLAVRFLPKSTPIGWLSLVVTIAISHLTWTWIETPFSKIRWPAGLGPESRQSPETN